MRLGRTKEGPESGGQLGANRANPRAAIRARMPNIFVSMISPQPDRSDL